MSHCWKHNVGWNRRKPLKIWKTQGQMYDFMKPLLRKLSDYIILPIGTNYALDNTSREILDKILKLESIYRRNYRNAKSLFQQQLNDTTMGKHR